MPISYRQGYKYQLHKSYQITLPKVFEQERVVETKFLRLASPNQKRHPEHSAPVLTIKAGYAWDGASGPTFDTPNSMRGSLVHDALYQLIRHELIPPELKAPSDQLFWAICNEDGMRWWRSFAWWRAVVRFGGGSATPGETRPVLTAP